MTSKNKIIIKISKDLIEYMNIQTGRGYILCTKYDPHILTIHPIHVFFEPLVIIYGNNVQKIYRTIKQAIKDIFGKVSELGDNNVKIISTLIENVYPIAYILTYADNYSKITKGDIIKIIERGLTMQELKQLEEIVKKRLFTQQKTIEIIVEDQ